MPRGAKPGEYRGGRKKGTPNRKTQRLQELVANGGITPLEYMLNMLRAPEPKNATLIQRLAWRNQRFEAAKAAAPYIHPRMGSTEIDPNKTADAARKIRQQLSEMDATDGAPPPKTPEKPNA
jgi:hypothetical protein